MEYHQFCSKAIVKSLIRFEREMVINFIDNTIVRYGVLPVLLHGIYRLGLGNKINNYFGVVR